MDKIQEAFVKDINSDVCLPGEKEFCRWATQPDLAYIIDFYDLAGVFYRAYKAGQESCQCCGSCKWWAIYHHDCPNGGINTFGVVMPPDNNDCEFWEAR